MSNEDFIGKAVEVYWEDEEEWYPGVIESFNPKKGFLIQYADGDSEYIKSLDPRSIRFVDDDSNTNKTSQATSIKETIKQVDSEEDEIIVIPSNNSLQTSAPLRVNVNKNAVITSSIKSPDDFEADSPPASPQIPLRRKNPLINSKTSISYESKYETGTKTADSNQRSAEYLSKNLSKNNPLSDEDEDENLIHAPEEEIPNRGVVLSGRVFSAANLPILSEDELDGRVFFRVLYAEGNNNPTSSNAMFKCKTAIFRSEYAIDLSNPEWDEGQFRFEMIIPPDETIATIQGDILIVIYRNRSQGGSDFIGQISFPIQEMRKSGTVTHQYDGVEVHSFVGSYPLIGRLGDHIAADAEVDVDLRLAWNPDTLRPLHMDDEYENGTSRSPGRNRGRKAAPSNATSTSRPASRSNASNRTTSTKPSEKQLGAGNRSRSAGPAGGRQKSAGSSHGSIRRRREAERIDEENRMLQKRLQQHETKAKAGDRGGAGAPGSARSALAVEEPTRKSIYGAPLPSRRSSTPMSVVSSRVKPTTARQAEVGEEGKERDGDREARAMYELHSELSEKYLKLRDLIANKEKDFKALKSKLNFLRTQVSKYEFTVKRLRTAQSIGKSKPTAGSQSASQPATPASDNRADRAESKFKEEREGQECEDRALLAPVASISLEAPKINPLVVPGTGHLLRIEDPQSFSDRELQELAGEFEALQEVRRTVLKRIALAQTNSHNTEAEIQRLQSSISSARQFLSMSISENVKVNEKSLKRKNDRLSSILKNGSQQDEEGGQEVKDLLEKNKLMNKLRTIRVQSQIYEFMKQSEMHLGATGDERDELRQLVKNLKMKLRDADEDLKSMEFERDVLKENLSRMQDERILEKLRSSVAQIYNVLSRARRRSSLSALSNGVQAIELGLVKQQRS